MKLAVFAYNFPHKKTQDFLLRLFLEGYPIEFVVACDPIKLNIPPSILRVKPAHIDVVHPEAICRRLGIPYHVLPHNSSEVAELMSSQNIDIGVVAGARILKKPVIESVKKGIINFHPGLIPEVRGLDALKWAIYHNLPVGVTAHFIDERVDAGRIIVREEIPLKKDDTLVDISLRLEQTQTNLLPRVLELVKNKTSEDYGLTQCQGKANPAMPNELEKEIPQRLTNRLAALDRAAKTAEGRK
jgi:folate-dependent phosphoribosylglycinamide formyltransferase PurN